MIQRHEAKYISQKSNETLDFSKNVSIPTSLDTKAGTYMFYHRKETGQLFVYDKDLNVVEEVYL